MKVLIVRSGNTTGVFVKEQAEAINNKGLTVQYFHIYGRGIRGYLKSFKALKQAIQNFKPDLIHAHYGFSGLLSNFQRKIPVITTYHGSDINEPKILIFSIISIFLSKYNIFVSKPQFQKVSLFNKRKYSIIPCGINIDLFKPPLIETEIIGKDILFSSGFDIPVKNYPLASKAIKLLSPEINLIELKGYTRDQVRDLLLKGNLVLMTSLNEGSPQLIKEAMACNCPIVSTDVGDVREIIGNTEGCYITTFEPTDIANKIKMALEFTRSKGRTTGRQRIIDLGLGNENVSQRIIAIYNKVINN